MTYISDYLVKANLWLCQHPIGLMEIKIISKSAYSLFDHFTSKSITDVKSDYTSSWIDSLKINWPVRPDLG